MEEEINKNVQNLAFHYHQRHSDPQIATGFEYIQSQAAEHGIRNLVLSTILHQTQSDQIFARLNAWNMLIVLFEAISLDDSTAAESQSESSAKELIRSRSTSVYRDAAHDPKERVLALQALKLVSGDDQYLSSEGFEIPGVVQSIKGVVTTDGSLIQIFYTDTTLVLDIITQIQWELGEDLDQSLKLEKLADNQFQTIDGSEMFTNIIPDRRERIKIRIVKESREGSIVKTVLTLGEREAASHPLPPAESSRSRSRSSQPGPSSRSESNIKSFTDLAAGDKVDRRYDLRVPFSFDPVHRFKIERAKVEGIENKSFAVDLETDTPVAIWFYRDPNRIDYLRNIHQLLAESQHVPRLIRDSRSSRTVDCQYIVQEKEESTLRSWLELPHRYFSDCKALLAQISRCLYDCHSKDLVLGNVNPDVFGFFNADFKWKLINLEDVARVDERPLVIKDVEFVAPEVFQALDKGVTEVMVTKEANMWSFGVLTLRIFKDSGLYGKGASEEFVKECLRNGELPGLNEIENIQLKSYVENCLKIRPEERIRAKEAYEENRQMYETFYDEVPKMENEEEESETSSEDTEGNEPNIRITLEEIDGVGQPLETLRGIRVNAISDNELRGEPCFLLTLMRVYLLRISLVSSQSARITAMSIKASDDERPVEVETVETRRTESEHEVVGLFDPSKHSSQKLRSVSPTEGTLEERYVKLDFLLRLELSEGEVVSDIVESMHCKVLHGS